MTGEVENLSIQPVQVAKSRRGQAGLVLVLVAMTLAFAFWWQRADAVLPQTTAVVSQSPATPGPASGSVTYTLTANLTVPGTHSFMTMELDVPTNLANPVLTCTAPGGTGTAFDNFVSSGPGNFTCHWHAAFPAGNYVLSVTGTVPPDGTDLAAPTDGEICDDTNDNGDCDDESGANFVQATNDPSVGPLTVENLVQVECEASGSETCTNAAGAAATFTFTLPASVTCQSDPDVADTDTDVDCVAADVVIGGDGNLTVTGVTVADPDLADESTVTVTVEPTDPESDLGGTVALLVTANVGDDGVVADVDFTSEVGTKIFVLGELRHVDDDGNIILDQEVNNNVRGRRHTICVFTDDEIPAPVLLPGLSVGDINVEEGGSGPVGSGDFGPTFTDPLVFTGTEGDSTGATCFSWVSTGAGDQEISIEYEPTPGTFVQLNWDTDADGNGGTVLQNRAIIKEWNVLQTSDPFVDAACETTDAGTIDVVVDCDVFAFFNPATSTYDIGSILVTDVFLGNHINRTGVLEGGAEGLPLWGVEVEVNVLTSCGTISPVQAVTGPDGSISFTIQADDECLLGDEIVVAITGCEPSPLGSGTGLCVTETIILNLITPLQTKQVFLAWAGQRIILEHDWRIPPGDVDGSLDSGDPDGTESPEPEGICPFAEFADEFGEVEVRYVRGSGPGNFLANFDESNNGPDEVFVFMDASDASQTDGEDIIGDPNGMCISRTTYESEEQGQVDIEIEIDDELGEPIGQTKVAIVVYYMQFEVVGLSIVPGQNKVNHNGTGDDYAPGNPWNASTDVVTHTDNVSADVLVRGRVKGWFTNGVPSGRPAVPGLAPADRWVMPDDWALLAGGPAGEDVTGIAEQFSPQYDLMIAPNSGFLCATVIGECADINDPLTGIGDVSAPDLAIDFDAGIDSPIEGPYSLLDFPGDGSAALSDIDPNNVRETILQDGDIDYWDAPMPPANISVAIRGAGFIKQVLKQDVYYVGTPNGTQSYNNPFYESNIPDSPFIPAVVAGGGYSWNTWGNDGPGGNGMGSYDFWEPVAIGTNSVGLSDPLLANAALHDEIHDIRAVYGDDTIARDLFIMSDNHGEFMVTANGDFNLTYDECVENAFFGGQHCDVGDLVGTSTLTAVADYPDFRGKWPALASNNATINWTWGGYKTVSIEDGETPQFKYIVFHAKDRDGFCDPGSAFSLHPVLSSEDALFEVGANDPVESVDFLIDAGEGIIVSTSGGGTINDGAQFATGVPTFDTADFPSLQKGGVAGECQAWIRVSNSLLGIVNILVRAHDDEGDIGFDVIVDLQTTMDYTLTFRWSLITWAGADNIPVADALHGTGANEAGNDIYDSVTAVYGWNQAAQEWLAFFPSGVNVPGANDLLTLDNGAAYWIAIEAPGPVTWTIAKNVGP
jgi:hypothetical protein